MTSNVVCTTHLGINGVAGQSLRGSGATICGAENRTKITALISLGAHEGQRFSAGFVDGAWHALSRGSHEEQTERAPRGKSTKRPSGATRYEIDAYPAQYNTFV